MTIETRNQSNSEELVGTVKLYHRHLIVCTGSEDWAARIENDGDYLQDLAQAIARAAEQTDGKVKLTACDEISLGHSADGRIAYDILVFPDCLRYENVHPSDFAALIEDHLIGNRPSDRLPFTYFDESYVFVCSHGNRDDRCGQCGPPLVDRFRAELETRMLSEQIHVRKVSHLGGHAYAGNVLIYPGGHWYGYVTPADVPLLIDTHLVNHRITKSLWRGRMGLSPEEQLAQYAEERLEF
jgi:hypothetical protein